jgi:hypothetical protein
MRAKLFTAFGVRTLKSALSGNCSLNLLTGAFRLTACKCLKCMENDLHSAGLVGELVGWENGTGIELFNDRNGAGS